MRWNDWRLIAVLAGVILTVVLLLIPGAGGDAFGGGCPMPPRHLSDITCRLPHAGCGAGLICFDGQLAFEILFWLAVVTGGLVLLWYGITSLCGKCLGPVVSELAAVRNNTAKVGEISTAVEKLAGSIKDVGGKVGDIYNMIDVSSRVTSKTLKKIKHRFPEHSNALWGCNRDSYRDCKESRVGRLERRVDKLENRFDHRFDRLEEMIRSKKA